MRKKRNNKRLGSNRENNLVKTLQNHGYVALRSSLSAGGWIREVFKKRHPDIYKRLVEEKRKKGYGPLNVKPIDIIAMKLGEYYFLQVSKHEKDISEDEKTVLDDLARQAMAIPVLGWIDVKNNSGRWKFVDMWSKREIRFWK